MAGTRRTTVASNAGGGEERSPKKEVVVIMDDGERGEECPLEAEVAKLRGRWELASVLNFLNVFEPLIESKLKISAEEIEKGLINPNSSLAQLHIALLKGIPPVSKALDGSDAWVTVLCKKLSEWWPWVAEGDIPLVAAKGEEIAKYKGLDPTNRLLLLKALCELRADQHDTVAYINDALKEGTQISFFRKDKIGGDGNKASFWYDGNKTLGLRLYRGITTFDSKTKSKRKGCDLSSFQWETLATNLEEFRKFAGELSSNKVVAEAAVGWTVENDAIPALERFQKNKERAMKKKQRAERVQNDFRSSYGTRFTRSSRIRKPVDYTYDDYDRAIKEAIHLTKNMKNRDEQKEERENGESGRGKSVAANGTTDSEDSSNKGDGDSYSAGDHIDISDEEDSIDFDMLQDVGREDDDNDKDYDGKADEDDFELERSNNQTDSFAWKPVGVRMSSRLAKGTNDPFVENRNLGTKNRLRQRPTRNSALDTIVIPDSDDES
ncbi:hypothetical protein UlMin_034508 [Ulmus minor]